MPLNQGQIDQMEARKEALKEHERLKIEVGELHDLNQAQRAQLEEAKLDKNRIMELELENSTHDSEIENLRSDNEKTVVDLQQQNAGLLTQRDQLLQEKTAL